MSQYIFTNYSVTEDLTTEDEGFNSREEDSIYNSSPRTPRTEEDRETASIVSTDIVEESTTETVQSYSDTISNSDSDSVDSFSSIESQIEQFFQYQRENREKFGGILEQQISRLRREQFDPEFPERKCFTEDSTQTTYVENKSLSAICTYVKSLRELISEKIQADDITGTFKMINELSFLYCLVTAWLVVVDIYGNPHECDTLLVYMCYMGYRG